MVKGETPHPNVMRAVRVGQKFALRKRHLTWNGREHVPDSSYDEVIAWHMRNNAQPTPGAGIIVANHRNDKLDVPVIGMAIKRQAYYPAKQEINTGMIGKVLEGCGALYFDRDDDDDGKRIFRIMNQKLLEGFLLVIFLERTSKNSGQQLAAENLSASAAWLAMIHKLKGIGRIGLGGTEDPDTTRVHAEIGSQIPTDLLFSDELGAKRRDRADRFTEEIIRPSLQEVIDISYSKIAA